MELEFIQIDSEKMLLWNYFKSINDDTNAEMLLHSYFKMLKSEMKSGDNQNNKK
jgi:hypothetical protein